ncbi:hypothetical protein E2562_021485 [Oryza meyeriana var. granulata]|uniref:Uncharacterized protein n=1 Tax=Oryza meyeriana var. granulata TaxID=110450 RepID=A0A6G1DY62_9ORYZ|nr:hypothetical protein E2562_021485 [Oryza meyeriana var. granulata]
MAVDGDPRHLGALMSSGGNDRTRPSRCPPRRGIEEITAAAPGGIPGERWMASGGGEGDCSLRWGMLEGREGGRRRWEAGRKAATPERGGLVGSSPATAVEVGAPLPGHPVLGQVRSRDFAAPRSAPPVPGRQEGSSLQV